MPLLHSTTSSAVLLQVIVTSCDETWTPLLDQGLVEASGSFALLTFALKR
jgi:hypothetical protein